MTIHHILVASYTDSVSTLTFDSEARTLAVTSSVKTGHHPSWIARHPSDPSLVFTCSESSDGKVFALKLDKAGKAEIVDEASSGGADPCALVATEDELIIGNYSAGRVVVLPISTSAPFFPTPSPLATFQLSGTGPQTDRQESSHPHDVVLHSNARQVLVPDLGADKTWCIARDTAGGWATPTVHITYAPGQGPRHLKARDDVLYTVCELSNELTAHRLSASGAPTLIASTPAKSRPPTKAIHPNRPALAAEILISPPHPPAFPETLIYVSNRNDPDEGGDIVGVFRPETLERVAEVRTGIHHLRGMDFGGEHSQWIVAGGLYGPGVKVFERVDGGRGLKEIASTKVDSPVGFVWL